MGSDGKGGSRSPSKRSSAQELSTPEALRRDAESRRDRAGEEQADQGSPADAKPPSKLRARMRRCGRAMVFVPWVALLSLALMVGGLALFAIKAKAASGAAADLLGYLGSADAGQGFPAYLRAWDSSIYVTVGVAGACVALLVVVAVVRLDQRLRKTGKYSSGNSAYGELKFKFWCFLAYLGLVITLMLALWAVVNCVLLSSWAAQAWNLEKGATAATANVGQLAGMGTTLKQSVGDFAVQLQTAVDAVAAMEAQAAGTAALPKATGKKAVKEALTIKNLAPAPAPAAEVPTKPASAQIEEALVPLASTLQAFSTNISEVLIPSTVQQRDGACPSAACFNLAYYPVTESTQCMCTAAGTQTTADLAQAASDTAVWALAGAAAVCAGALVGAVELGADAAVLRADQQFLKVAKRSRSSRSSSGRASGARRESRHSSYSDMSQMGMGLPHKSPSAGIMLHARG